MPEDSQPRRIAIVHEWFTSMRGGEKCVEAMCEVFPGADVYALLHVPGSVSPTIERALVRTSFIQRLPSAATQYRRYLPLFPLAIRGFDLAGYDLVISSNHCVAKGVKTHPGTLHICYCYTPMRYIWGQYDDYFGKGRADLVTRAAMKVFVGPLRGWDLATAANPHYYVAVSENTRRRIRDIYHRSSDVIYPPVDTARFAPGGTSGDYYLMVSALVPYKALDLAIAAFNATGDRLVIVGEGPDRRRLEAMAGPAITFEGWQPDDRLAEYYAGCKAVIFPGEEDFGIVPVEAMAAGKPVLAYARGGALETVVSRPDLRTGILVHEQTVDALLEGIRRLKETAFDPDALRRHAAFFDRLKFKERMHEYCLTRWRAFTGKSLQAHI